MSDFVTDSKELKRMALMNQKWRALLTLLRMSSLQYMQVNDEKIISYVIRLCPHETHAGLSALN